MRHPDRVELARTLFSATAGSLLSILWSPALAVVLRDALELDPPLVAVPLTVTAALAGASGGLGARRSARDGALAGLLVALGGLLVTWWTTPGAFAAMVATLVVAPVVGAGARWLHLRIPDAWCAELAAPWSLGVLGLGAVVTVVQFARLAAHVADPSVAFVLSTSDPFWAEHECLPAYVHAAELADRGEPNVWDAAHYPGIHPGAEPHTELSGMAIEDPYQYTPQFLLLPYVALSLTDAYPTIRAVWFALQVTAFVGIALGLLGHLGRRPAALGLLALPFALTGFATLYNFQYGQVHLLAIALGVTATVAFARDRNVAGGAMLTFAIAAKLFPAVLLLPLAAAGRRRAIGWTLGWLAAATVATLAIFGPAPFEAFVTYHLPRLRSGEAVAFWDAWPAVADLLIADNQGPFGIVLKLGRLGVPHMGAATASTVSTVYLVGVGIAAFAVGHGWRRAPAGDRIALSLGLLGLASLGSPAAFGDYVPAAATWLLTLMAGHIADLPRGRAIALGIVGASLYTVFGTAPIGAWFDVPLLVASIGTAMALLAVFAWPVVRELRRRFPARSLLAVGRAAGYGPRDIATKRRSSTGSR